MLRLRARRQPTEDRGQSGQTLVEFALVIPLIVFLFMGLMEVGLLFNAFVGVNRASQNGAHLAAIMGNQANADCLILKEIEEDVYVPNEPVRIQQVIVERSTRSGTGGVNGIGTLAEQRYVRDNTPRQCDLPDGTVNFVPYCLVGAAVDHPLHDAGCIDSTGSPVAPASYPEDQRCNVLKGCPDPPFTQARSTVDNIAVQIRYRHLWATPLNEIFSMFPGGDVGWLISQRNIFRIEPVL